MVSPGWRAEPASRGEMAFTTSMPSVALPKDSVPSVKVRLRCERDEELTLVRVRAGPWGRAVRNADLDGPYTSSIKIV